VAVFKAGPVRGSDGEVSYPPSEVWRSLPRWNGLPLTAGHPWDWTGDRSATDPGMWDTFGLGFLRNADLVGGKVWGDCWLELARLRRLAPGLEERLAAGLPVAVSAGLYFDRDRDGTTARDLRPDHIALLEGPAAALPPAKGYGLLVC
jgi:hypothetical protein